MRYRYGIVTLLVISAVLAIGCSASAASEHFTKTGKHFEQAVGPEGGEIRFQGLTLIIPPGALNRSRTITVETVKPKASHHRRGLISQVYEFGPEHTRFPKPLTIIIPVRCSPSNLPPHLGIYWFNPVSESWERLSSSHYNAESQTVTASIDHFSSYAVAGGPADDFSDGFSPYRMYFCNNSEVVSPQTGTLRILRSQFDLPGRVGLNLRMADVLDSAVFDPTGSYIRESDRDPLMEFVPLLPQVEYLSHYHKAQLEGDDIDITTSDETRVSWNGGKYDVTWSGVQSVAGGRLRSGSVHSGGIDFSIEVYETWASYAYTPKNATIYDSDGTKYYFADGRTLSSITDKTGGTTLTFSVNKTTTSESITLSDALQRTITRTRNDDTDITQAILGPVNRSFQTKTTTLDVNLTTYTEEATYTDPAGRITRYTLKATGNAESGAISNASLQSLTIEYPTGGKSVYTFQNILAGNNGSDYYRAVVKEHKRYATKTDTTPVSTTTFQYTLNATTPHREFDEVWYSTPTVYDIGACLVNDGITKTRLEFDAPLRYVSYNANITKIPSYKVPGPKYITIWDASVPDSSLTLSNFLKRVENVYDPVTGNLIETRVYRSGSSVPAQVIQRAYDDWGNVTYEKDPIGHEKFYSYLNTSSANVFPLNSYGFSNSFYDNTAVNPRVHNLMAGSAEVQSVGGRRIETYVKYDPRGIPVEKKQLHRGNWTYTRWGSDQYGNITSLTDPDGHTTTYNYGPEYYSAYLTKESQSISALWINNAESSTIEVAKQYAYDIQTGERTKVIDPNGNTTGYVFDSIGRLKDISFPIVSNVAAHRSATYDDVNNTITVNDENGVPTKYYYDGLGRLSKIESLKKDTSGNYTITAFTKSLTYDSKDKVVMETVQADGKSYVTGYTHDALGRLTTTTFPDGTTTRIEYIDNYSSAGTAATLARRVWDENGQLKEYGYDAAERLLWVKEYPIKGNSVSFIKTSYEYDELGRLVRVTDGNTPARITSFAYDEFGHLLATTYPDGTTSVNDCRASGDVVARTDRKGQTITLTYDEAHRLRKTRDPNGNVLSEYWYDKPGNRARTSSSGVTTTYTYDARNRVTNITRTIGGKSFPISLDYDPANNRKSFAGPDLTARTLVYDERNRLKSVSGFQTGGAAKHLFEYYDVGPLKRVTFANGILADYAIDQRLRPTTVGFAMGTNNLLTLSYRYDNVGNVVFYDGVTYEYDGLNRLEKGL
ncbi:MAG: hypothetical protein QME79_09560 [Bacillota bacterium]|nr:hypothetical protein [Bacillota bacterium]